MILARLAPGTGSIWWAATAGILAGAGLATRGLTCRLSLGGAVVMLAGSWFIARTQEAGATALAPPLSDEPVLLDLEGTVASNVRLTPRRGTLARFVPSEPASAFLLRVHRSFGDGGSGTPVNGRLWVFVPGRHDDLMPGDRVRTRGFVRGIKGPTNPGQRDTRLWARSAGIAGTMNVASASLLVRVPEERNWLGRLAGWKSRTIGMMRQRARTWLIGAGSEDGGQIDPPTALLEALVLGQREVGLHETSMAFARVGVAHVLAVSGMHLMALAGLVFLVLRAVGARPGVELVVVGALVLVYMMLVPSRAPIVRAGSTVLALLVAQAMGRRYDPVTVLGWVAIGVLIWKPAELWSMGFQLSFGVVGALMTIARPLRTRLFGPRPERDTYGIGRWFLERGKDALTTAACAWVVAFPIIVYHVGVVSPLGLVSQLVVVPIALVLVGASFVGLLGSALWPAAGELVRPILHGGAHALVELVMWMDSLPGVAVYLPRIEWWWALTVLVAFGWSIGRARETGRRRRVRMALWGFAGVWLVWSMVRVGLPGERRFRLDTLDVGDGTCHLVRSGREAMLYDCGSLNLAIGQYIIPRAVRALGAWRVPTIVLTHANTDHFAGLLDVIRPLGVRRVLVGEGFVADADRKPGGAAAWVLEELDRRGVAVEVMVAGDTIDIGSVQLEVVSPARGQRWARSNDSSLVSLVHIPVDGGERRVLLTGDIQQDAIRSIMDRPEPLRADVLEVPHHGSARPAAFEFVGWVDPGVVVQSTGRSRRDDHRWDDVRSGRTWLSTAVDGVISVSIRRDGTIEMDRLRNR